MIKCQRKSNRKDLLLALKASYRADTKDAERIIERALIFSKVYELKAFSIVVSKELSPVLENRFKEVLLIRVEAE